MTKLKTDDLPGILTYKRSITGSDALLYGATSTGFPAVEGITPVKIKNKDVRGQDGAYGSKKTEPDGFRAGNPQTISYAHLEREQDVIILEGTLVFAGFSAAPEACNNREYKQLMEQLVATYKAKVGFKELANRYLTQIENGSYLWRNLDAAKALEVSITCNGNQYTVVNQTKVSDAQVRQTVLELIEKALGNNETKFGLGAEQAFIEYSAKVHTHKGFEVYPSEEMDMDKKPGENSRPLFFVENDGIYQAALHSQKVTNRIRAIDDWNTEGQAIAVEPFGINQAEAYAYRPLKAGSLYDFLLKVDDLIEALEEGKQDDVSDAHYVVACLIRGGVYGLKNNKDKE